MTATGVMTPRSVEYLERIAGQIAPIAPAAIADRVRTLVRQHETRRLTCLNMLASENTISRGALALLSSTIATRLTEGFPGDKEFPPAGQNVEIDEIEAILIALVRRLLPARFIEWRATSNTMANAIALAAVTRPGDRILVQSLQGGGNMSYHPGAVPDLLGLSVGNLPPGPCFDIDLEAARRAARAARPTAIVVGGSYMLFPLPVPELRAIADEVGAALIYDAAHVGLLIAAGLFPDPLRDGADILTLGTHKIMGGPIGGLVLTNREDLAERVVNRTYPLFLQTRDQNKYAAAAHSMAELVAFGSEYARQMVANARTLAAALAREGCTVVGADRGYTATHQLLVDARPLGGPSAEARCQAANILVHKARMVDDDPDSTARSGIRITTQEITRQGMEEADMVLVARLMADAAWKRRPGELLLAEVARLAGSYPDIHYSFDENRFGLHGRAP